MGLGQFDTELLRSNASISIRTDSAWLFIHSTNAYGGFPAGRLNGLCDVASLLKGLG